MPVLTIHERPRSRQGWRADRCPEAGSRPVPTPEAGQALIRVKATPIHASDLHVLRGRYGFSPEFPTVGGHMECVGRIEALGPDTEGLEIGERVVAVAVPAVPGSHDEWLLQTAAGSTVGRLVIQLARHLGIPTINVVRRRDAVEEIKALGGDEVICTEDEDLLQRVAEIAGPAGVRKAIDCVAGHVGAQVS
jgi:NADPH:quinone reductase-like Zn-dependent oxidoreductase